MKRSPVDRDILTRSSEIVFGPRFVRGMERPFGDVGNRVIGLVYNSAFGRALDPVIGRAYNSVIGRAASSFVDRLAVWRDSAGHVRHVLASCFALFVCLGFSVFLPASIIGFCAAELSVRATSKGAHRSASWASLIIPKKHREELKGDFCESIETAKARGFGPFAIFVLRVAKVALYVWIGIRLRVTDIVSLEVGEKEAR